MVAPESNHRVTEWFGWEGTILIICSPANVSSNFFPCFISLLPQDFPFPPCSIPGACCHARIFPESRSSLPAIQDQHGTFWSLTKVNLGRVAEFWNSSSPRHRGTLQAPPALARPSGWEQKLLPSKAHFYFASKTQIFNRYLTFHRTKVRESGHPRHQGRD